jgi:hypothetical protein
VEIGADDGGTFGREFERGGAADAAAGAADESAFAGQTHAMMSVN